MIDNACKNHGTPKIKQMTLTGMFFTIFRKNTSVGVSPSSRNPEKSDVNPSRECQVQLTPTLEELFHTNLSFPTFLKFST